MEPFEVLISESQERMLAVVEPERWDEVRAVCERWGLPVAVIGVVTDDGDIAVVDEAGAEIARIPASALTSDAIVHARIAAAPVRRRAAPAPGAPSTASDGLPERGMDPGAVLTGAPRLGRTSPAAEPVFEQYDSTVQANTVAGPGHGAAVLRIKGTTKALVATTDANQAVGALDPWLGAALSVAEATRNVAITGARPLGVTNCLNYGDPTRPEAFWQLTEAVRGLGRRVPRARPARDRRQRLALQRVAGRLDRADAGDRGRRPARRRRAARRPGVAGRRRRVLLVGEATPGLAGSEYARLAGLAAEDGPPSLDLDRERRLQAFLREAAARELLASAQDVSGGGLAVALAECAMWADDERRSRRPAPARRRELAGRRPVRREPVAAWS